MSMDLVVATLHTRMDSSTDKLVMVALAEHAWSDGTHCYPSLDRLALYGSMNRATVRRSLRRLLSDGWISPVAPATQHRAAEYHVNVEKLQGLQFATPGIQGLQPVAPEVASGPPGVATRPARGSTAQPEPKAVNQEEPKTEPLLLCVEAVVPSRNGHKASLTPEGLAELFNTQAPAHLSRVPKVVGKRREKAQRLLRTFPEREWWAQVLAQYQASRFLLGQTEPRPGHGSFKPDFDWLLSNGKDGIENAQKVHDGRYADDRERAPERRSGPDL